MEVTVKKPEKMETLKVNIGDESFDIPLGMSLTVDEFASLDTFRGTVKFFNKFIPDRITKNLTFAEYNQITEAWREATRKSGKINSGE